MRPRLLDAFCCQGGAGEGYRRAGFGVVGVDIEPQPRNPGRTVVGDAVDTIRHFGGLFDAIHASPPCQHYSDTQRLMGNDHPDLIAEVRAACIAAGVPYVIENVRGARDKLHDPVMLCGAMFGLRTYRHRYFETDWPLTVPLHPQHVVPQVKMGRAPKPGEWVQAVGNFSGVQEARDAMDIQWMNRDGLRECIPPAYTEFIGRHLLAEITVRTGGSRMTADPRSGPHWGRPKPDRCTDCGAASHYLTNGRCDHRRACEARRMLNEGASSADAARHAQRLDR